jgi:hypothetical protein
MTFTISATLPEGFAVTHLIHLDPCWQVILASEDHIVTATGETIEDAFAYAAQKVDEGKYNDRFSLYNPQLLERTSEFDTPLPLTLADLGLAQAKPIARRKL